MSQDMMLAVEADQALVPAAAWQRLADAFQQMAASMQATHERMAALERQVRLLEKVTPSQEKALHAAIRLQALQLCQRYRCPGAEKQVAAQIRKALRLQTGTRSMRELPRCEYPVAMTHIGIWNDAETMMNIRKKGRAT